MSGPCHAAGVTVLDRTGTVTVAVTGNPNAGKSATFNAMTGVRQKTGNWPGVTVERKEGRYTHDGRHYTLVDLPGTYSLDALSPDQRIARDFVVGDEVDVVLAVVDATNLERHLYLAVQLAEMGVPMVIAVNMMDVAERLGIQLDTEALGAAFGCDVVPVVAVTGTGIRELEAAIARAAWAEAPPDVRVPYGDSVDAAVRRVVAALPDPLPSAPPRADRHWLARRLLEGDPTVVGWAGPRAAEVARVAAASLATELGDDVDVLLADRRYTVANQIAHRVVNRPNASVGMLSDRVDRAVMHRIWGVPIFLAAMYLMFMFTINVGGAFIDVFDGVAGAIFVEGLRALLGTISAPEWAVVVLADGVGGGIQVVATFIPIIAALYLFLSVLEDSGYMSRAAFVMDRAMRRIGLPGKAFVPLIVGFGCNVPAVMATRTLEDERERKLTILMNPFMSCGARLPVYALFAAAFFPNGGQNLVFLLYLIGIAVAVGTGVVMKHTLLPGRSEGFLMELPAYHRPTVRGAVLHSWERTRVFVRKAGGVIVAMVVALAVLNSLGTDGSFGNEDSRESVLSEIGRNLTPVFEPMGLEEENWPATVGIFTGVLAKEAVVGTLDSLYGTLAEQDAGVVEAEEPFDLRTALGDSFATVPGNLAAVADTVTDPFGIGVGDVGTIETAAAEQEVDAGVYGAMQSRFDGRLGAFSYLLFVLLYFPCVAVIGAIVREAGRTWALFVAAWSTAIAYLIATAFYQAGRLPAQPAASLGWLAAVGAVTVIAVAALRRWSRGRSEPVAVPVVVRGHR